VGLFDALIERHERERHASILSSLPPRRRGDRADRWDGFLPVARAAAVMGVSEVEVVEMAGRGLLEQRDVDGKVFIRPAVVTVLGVSERGRQ
jgi:hypothetical protein